MLTCTFVEYPPPPPANGAPSRAMNEHVREAVCMHVCLRVSLPCDEDAGEGGMQDLSWWHLGGRGGVPTLPYGPQRLACLRGWACLWDVPS